MTGRKLLLVSQEDDGRKEADEAYDLQQQSDERELEEDEKHTEHEKGRSKEPFLLQEEQERLLKPNDKDHPPDEKNVSDCEKATVKEEDNPKEREEQTDGGDENPNFCLSLLPSQTLYFRQHCVINQFKTKHRMVFDTISTTQTRNQETTVQVWVGCGKLAPAKIENTPVEYSGGKSHFIGLWNSDGDDKPRPHEKNEGGSRVPH